METTTNTLCFVFLLCDRLPLAPWYRNRSFFWLGMGMGDQFQILSFQGPKLMKIDELLVPKGPPAPMSIVLVPKGNWVGKSYKCWGLSENVGDNQKCWERSKKVGKDLKMLGKIWKRLQISNIIWKDLTMLGKIWKCSERSKHARTYLKYVGKDLQMLGKI